MNRTEPQEAVSQVEALQVEVATLRQKLEFAEKFSRGLQDAYAGLEKMHTPTEDEEAYQKMADAWATLVELGLGGYLTGKVYDDLGDVLNNLLNDIQWQQDPAVLRQVLPALFCMHQEQDEAKKAQGASAGAQWPEVLDAPAK